MQDLAFCILQNKTTTGGSKQWPWSWACQQILDQMSQMVLKWVSEEGRSWRQQDFSYVGSHSMEEVSSAMSATLISLAQWRLAETSGCSLEGAESSRQEQRTCPETLLHQRDLLHDDIQKLSNNFFTENNNLKFINAPCFNCVDVSLEVLL